MSKISDPEVLEDLKSMVEELTGEFGLVDADRAIAIMRDAGYQATPQWIEENREVWEELEEWDLE